MNLENLLKANQIQWELKEKYVDRLLLLYPEYLIFRSAPFPEYFVFRLKSEEWNEDQSNDIHIHYTQLYSISR